MMFSSENCSQDAHSTGLPCLIALRLVRRQKYRFTPIWKLTSYSSRADNTYLLRRPFLIVGPHLSTTLLARPTVIILSKGKEASSQSPSRQRDCLSPQRQNCSPPRYTLTMNEPVGWPKH